MQLLLHRTRQSNSYNCLLSNLAEEQQELREKYYEQLYKFTAPSTECRYEIYKSRYAMPVVILVDFKNYTLQIWKYSNL